MSREIPASEAGNREEPKHAGKSNNAPRVLHVIDSMDLGGAQTVLLNLLPRLNCLGFECHAACMHGKGVFFSRMEEAGIPTTSLSSGKFPPAYLWNVPHLLRSAHFDIVHCHLFGSNWIAKPLAALLGDSALVSHDHCNDQLRHRKRFALFADACTNRFSDTVIGVSQSTCDFLLREEGVPEEKVRLVYNGVDTRQFHPPTPKDREAARASLDLSANALVIGGAGRLVAQKNFSLWLEVAKSILQRFPEAFFYLAGTGPLEEALKKQAERISGLERIRFAGFVSDQKALFHAMDVLLVTSSYEGLPMNVLEAMAAGVPVVGSEVDGLSEILTHGETALLCKPDVPDGFVQALDVLAQDPTARRALALRGRQLVEKEFSADLQAEKIQGIYRGLLAGRDNGG